MAGWEDLPDVEPKSLKKTSESSWETLPDLPAGSRRVKTGTGSPDFATTFEDEKEYAGPTPELVGSAKGASLGFADELAGAINVGEDVVDAIGNRISPATGDIDATELARRSTRAPGYVAGRDEYRKTEEAARKSAPGKFAAYELGGALLAPGPGGIAKAIAPAAKLGAAARVAGAGAMGGLAGLGYGDADLASGDFAGAAKDTAKGAGIGVAAGGVGELAGRGLQKLKGYFGGMSGKAKEDALRIATENQAKAEASAVGRARSATQSASRDIEVLEREASSLPDGHPLKERIKDYLTSEEVLRLRERIAGNKLKYSPERTSEMTGLEAELAALRGEAPANIEKGVASQLEDPIKKQVAPRLSKLAYRFLPVAATGAGGMIGSTIGSPFIGSGVGMALGGLTALIMGKPGTVVQNMVKSPGFRNFIGTHGEKLAEIGPKLQEAAAKGPVVFQAALDALRKSDPELDAAVRDAQNIDQDESKP